MKRLQLVTQFETWEKMIKSIPWGHNQRIVYKCKNIEEALFYVQKTIDNGWSRNVLIHQMEAGLYERQGKAIANFQEKLPNPQSDLAEQTLKDPYNFDFLTLHEEYNEKELENALVNQITQFLLELGTGFSYLGRQVHIYVSAVNKNMQSEQDNPTIGILICKDKDDVVAEYALEDMSQPIGIAKYELTKVLREDFKSSLPTVEEIQKELTVH